MQWAILITAAVIFSFGFVLMFGPPYLPTLKEQIDAALDLLDLKPGQVMIELGSGDGRVMKAAAKRGWKVVGYELNPILVLFSIITTWRYHSQIRVVWGNFWSKEWPPAAGVFTFIIGHKVNKLDETITKLTKRPIRLVSFAFQIPGKTVVKESHGVFLYEYK